MTTLDEMWAGSPASGGRPQWWMDRDGFFVIHCGRWREFGFAAGRMRWDYRYAKWLMDQVQKAVKATKKQ